MPRIAVAQWRQETNTFNPNPTRLADYRRFGLTWDGDEVSRKYRGVDELGGFYQTLDAQPDVETVALGRAVAWSGGVLERRAYRQLLDSLLRAVQQAGPLDGLLLSLHGATVAAGCFDLTGEVIQQVRARLGPSTPLVVTLDLHANLTAAAVRQADLIVGYGANPHIDQVDTGARAAELLLQLLARTLRPATAMRKLPLLLGAERQSTFEGPLGRVAGYARELERSGQAILARIYPVQPWLDVPALGSAVMVTCDGDPAAADRLADELASRLWAERDNCGEERLSPAEIARRVAAAPAGPLVISDGADATNSGAPGDSTVLARTFAAAGTPGPILLCFVDPLSAGACARAGIGARLSLPIGGRLDPRTGPPLTLAGKVRRLSDGGYRVSGHGGANVPVEAGPSAVFDADPLHCVLTSHTFIGSHPNVYRSLGLDPARARAVVVKSPYGFRHDYGPFAAEILLADCPGAASGDLRGLTFHHPQHPLYPQQPLSDWRRPETLALGVLASDRAP